MNPTNEWLLERIKTLEAMLRHGGTEENSTEIAAHRELLARRKADEGAVTVRGYAPPCVFGKEPEVWTNRHTLAVSDRPYDKEDITVTVTIRKEG